MIHHQKAIVASGHHCVSEAAAQILKGGGNTFDAIVAAGFASTVVEQTLTSLGGGGLLLGYSADKGQKLFFDFFVDTPGLGLPKEPEQPHFFPITVQFSGAPQEFNIGLGSVAVPGVAKGLLHIHKRLGRMSLGEIIQPAIQLAQGHILNDFQGHFLKLLYPIMTNRAAGRALYGEGEEFITPGETLVNEDLAKFIENLAYDNGESLYQGELAKAIASDMKEFGGLLTREDLAQYTVMERKPIGIPYRGAKILTSSFPSIGGALIGLSLSLYDGCDLSAHEWGSTAHLRNTIGVMLEVERQRTLGVTTPEALESFMAQGRKNSLENIRMFTRGTTHISIADKWGNCAAMTCSNGEGSGYIAPGTGIMLNNMMGEDDLHPEGFHSSPPGQRVISMMSPSLLIQGDEVKLVLGSGGSKRIRTAITQVLSQVVDYDRPLDKAVSAPRLFWDGECLQVEPGFKPEIINSLGVKANIWPQLDVYFGGVHAVIPGKQGAGDPRRGGSVIEV